MPENANPEDELFEAALLRSPGAERAAFLDGECRSDPELRARVEMMLEGHLNAKDFLETPPTGLTPERKMLRRNSRKSSNWGAVSALTSCARNWAKAAAASSIWPNRTNRCAVASR